MNVAELAVALIGYFPSTPLEKHLLFNLLYWLAEGSALSLEHIGRRLGYSREKLDEILKTLPGMEMDGAGCIVSAAGLSVRETSYPMDGEKCRVYAQSGLAAVLVPTLLLAKMGVEYRCPGESQSVCLRFGFDQAFAPQPEQAVISFPSRINLPKHLTDGRSEFQLFSSPDAARSWLGQHSGGGILSVKDVFLASVQLRRSLMDSNTSMLGPSR